MKIEKLESWEPGCSPMHEDFYHMGEVIGKSPNGDGSIYRLFPNHWSEVCNYFIVVDQATGERFKVIVEISRERD